jgi:hypothetical protein
LMNFSKNLAVVLNKSHVKRRGKMVNEQTSDNYSFHHFIRIFDKCHRNLQSPE